MCVSVYVRVTLLQIFYYHLSASIGLRVENSTVHFHTLPPIALPWHRHTYHIEMYACMC